MARRYKLRFTFFDTQEEAEQFCDVKNQNRYIRKHHKASSTPWSSQDKRQNLFIAWYSEQ